MHYSKILIATAFIQGGLSAKLLAYVGRDCTGAAESIALADDSCVTARTPFRSYKEDGFGSRQQRVSFWGAGACSSAYEYDTWAYDGDYFKSHKCYNINDHPNNDREFAYSVASKKGTAPPGPARLLTKP
ncbi:uncharacterized protein DNG_01610 [Cephalotrichum gorgonifer]|uniref:Uncharacterized protein n=1 Tax=Cephalotrichum gorgonifer TaxID=2041049 RepID=A0AAE8MS51_9PEZI|nr:uncharacterized protein DNG_01610 [Cephalotrichum gorgonifer]